MPGTPKWLVALSGLWALASMPAFAQPAMLQPSATGPYAAGAKIYAEVCAACHDGGVERAPQRYVLQQMSPEAIHRSLTDGAMREQGSAMPAADRVAVSEYLAERRIGSAAAVKLNMCTGRAARFDFREPPVHDGWGFDAANSHSIPAQLSGLNRRNAGTLKLRWAFAFSGATRVRSQPVLAGGAIYIGSQTGTVYALDRATGCVRWTFDAQAEVRTAVLVAPWRAGDAKAQPLAWFGDTNGNMYAVNALTGQQVWKVSADAHPVARLSATPALHGGVLYVPVSSFEEAASSNPAYACCTFRGSIVALDARTGAEKWRTWLIDEAQERGKRADGQAMFGPAGAPVWSSPAVDAARGQLYVTTGNNYASPVTGMANAVVAIDLASGRVNWAFQSTKDDAWNVACEFKAVSPNCPVEDGPDLDFGAGPILAKTKTGQDVVLAGQKSGVAFGLDPADGKMLWQTRIGRGGVTGGIHFGMAATQGVLFAPVNDAPDRKPSTFPMSPGLYALDAATGKLKWSAPNPDVCQGKPLCHNGLGAAITATADVVLAGSSDGHLRIYGQRDGAVLWDYDTLRDFETLDGRPGKGGSISGAAAPVVYKGQAFLGSGYGFSGKMAGNVLLAFGTGK